MLEIPKALSTFNSENLNGWIIMDNQQETKNKRALKAKH